MMPQAVCSTRQCRGLWQRRGYRRATLSGSVKRSVHPSRARGAALACASLHSLGSSSSTSTTGFRMRGTCIGSAYGVL